MFEENLEAATLFIRLSSQWKFAGSGVRVGLDYTAVDALFKILGVKEQVSIFDDLQVMEFAALAYWREMADKK